MTSPNSGNTDNVNYNDVSGEDINLLINELRSQNSPDLEHQFRIFSCGIEYEKAKRGGHGEPAQKLAALTMMTIGVLSFPELKMAKDLIPPILKTYGKDVDNDAIAFGMTMGFTVILGLRLDHVYPMMTILIEKFREEFEEEFTEEVTEKIKRRLLTDLDNEYGGEASKAFKNLQENQR